jgi:hypothetical protein
VAKPQVEIADVGRLARRLVTRALLGGARQRD